MITSSIDDSLLVEATENMSDRLPENEWLMLQTLRLFRRVPIYPIEKQIKVVIQTWNYYDWQFNHIEIEIWACLGYTRYD